MYLKDDEVLTRGTMHLVLLQDSITETSNEMIRIEKTELTFLQQNVGTRIPFARHVHLSMEMLLSNALV